MTLQLLLPWGSRIAAALPRALAEAAADGAGTLAWLASPAARARLAANLTQATGAVPRPSRLQCAFRAYARYYLAFMRLAHGTLAQAVGPHRWNGDAALASSLARGRGVLVLSGHLGNWDLVGAALAARFGRISVFAERLEPPFLFEFYTRVRARHGVHVVPVGAASRAPHAALARNGILGLVADRPFGRRTVAVPLGTGMLHVPAGGIDLALRAGAAIHAVFAVREQGEWVLECGPDLAPAASVPRVCAEYAAALAAAIARHPDQWCHLHALRPAEVAA